MPCSALTRILKIDPIWFRIFLRRLNLIHEDFNIFAQNLGDAHWDMFSNSCKHYIALQGMMPGLIVECSFDPSYHLLGYISEEHRFFWIVQETKGFIWSNRYERDTDTWNVVIVCNISEENLPVWAVARLRVRRAAWFCQQFTMLRPYALPEDAAPALQHGPREKRLRAFLTWCKFQDNVDSDSSSATLPDDSFALGIEPEI